jgi:hypothetical protein
MTMGLILRTVWKEGRDFRHHARGNDDVGNENGEEPGDREPDKEEENDDDDYDVIGGSQAFDTLCLVLGLLTNLVQIVDGAKDVVRKSREFFSSRFPFPFFVWLEEKC